VKQRCLAAWLLAPTGECTCTDRCNQRRLSPSPHHIALGPDALGRAPGGLRRSAPLDGCLAPRSTATATAMARAPDGRSNKWRCQDGLPPPPERGRTRPAPSLSSPSNGDIFGNRSPHTEV
jgi:hypothetical protein